MSDSLRWTLESSYYEICGFSPCEPSVLLKFSARIQLCFRSFILCTVEEAQMGFYLARKELFLLSG